MSDLSVDVLVNQCLPRFQKICETNGVLVKWEQESQFATQALQKNNKLRACEVETIQNSIINVAACGLTLNPADGYAYLVPEYNKGTGKNECMLRISFKGLIKAATDSGVIKWVRAEVVKENDKFEYRGPCEAPEHVMDPFAERGNCIGVYCIAKTSEGEILADVMGWDQVEKIKSSAKTQMVWDKWPEEMAKKAIIKRASKQWPKSGGGLNQTVHILNENEGSVALLTDYDGIAADVIEAIENDDIFGFGETWPDLSEEDKSVLWTAITKGGWFTDAQKLKIRDWTCEWRKMQNETIEGEAEAVE